MGEPHPRTTIEKNSSKLEDKSSENSKFISNETANELVT